MSNKKASRCSHVLSAGNWTWQQILLRKQSPCGDCGAHAADLWLCLIKDCSYVGCGEAIDDHSIRHAQIQKHPLAMNLTTKRVWCTDCNMEVYPNLNTPTFSITGFFMQQAATKVPSPPIVHESVTKPVPSYESDSDSEQQSYKPRGLTGLRNLGNTCYMNAALQALSNCQPLTRFFLDCPAFVKTEKNPQLSKSHMKLVSEIWHKKRPSYVVPSNVYNGIKLVHPMFRGYTQQDTQEFLRCYMDQLHEELKFPKTIENNDDNHDEIDCVKSPPISNSPVHYSRKPSIDSSSSQSEGDYETCDSGLSSDRSSVEMYLSGDENAEFTTELSRLNIVDGSEVKNGAENSYRKNAGILLSYDMKQHDKTASNGDETSISHDKITLINGKSSLNNDDKSLASETTPDVKIVSGRSLIGSRNASSVCGRITEESETLLSSSMSNKNSLNESNGSDNKGNESSVKNGDGSNLTENARDQPGSSLLTYKTQTNVSSVDFIPDLTKNGNLGGIEKSEEIIATTSSLLHDMIDATSTSSSDSEQSSNLTSHTKPSTSDIQQSSNIKNLGTASQSNNDISIEPKIIIKSSQTTIDNNQSNHVNNTSTTTLEISQTPKSDDIIIPPVKSINVSSRVCKSDDTVTQLSKSTDTAAQSSITDDLVIKSSESSDVVSQSSESIDYPTQSSVVNKPITQTSKSNEIAMQSSQSTVTVAQTSKPNEPATQSSQSTITVAQTSKPNEPATQSSKSTVIVTQTSKSVDTLDASSQSSDSGISSIRSHHSLQLTQQQITQHLPIPAKKNIEYRSVISDIFDGKLLSSVQCTTCERISTTKETFQDLSLPIPTQKHINTQHMSHPGVLGPGSCGEVHPGWITWIVSWMKSWFVGPPITLQDCLAAFFSADDLKGENMYSCEKCNKLRNGMKFSKVLQLPEILCIHLKRFRHEFMYSSKISSAMSFPIEDLDMTPYLHKDCRSEVTLYDLIAVICHHGTAGGGHYTSYCQNFINNQWYEFDDQYVTEVDVHTVMSCEAYVLFYGKKDDSAVPLRQKAMSLLDLQEDSILPFYISRQWVNRFNTFAEPGPIDNSDFVCSHGGVYPSQIDDVENLVINVARPLWTFLFERFGGGPACTRLYVCTVCLEEEGRLQQRQKYERDMFMMLVKKSKSPESSLGTFAGTCYLNVSWYMNWENFVNNKTQEPPGPINNRSISYTRNGELILRKGSDNCQISREMWCFLHGIYGGGPEISIFTATIVF